MTKTSQNSRRDVPKEKTLILNMDLFIQTNIAYNKGLAGASCVLKGVQKRKTSEFITVHKVEETTPKKGVGQYAPAQKWAPPGPHSGEGLVRPPPG